MIGTRWVSEKAMKATAREKYRVKHRGACLKSMRGFQLRGGMPNILHKGVMI